tara:strand:- start:1638 stop:1883 length:246 start_codon:yes stop_codon:yes gene_type:complete
MDAKGMYMDAIDKRTKSEVEAAFIEFVDKIQDLGFKFDLFDKVELTYIKGDAVLSPHSISNKLTLRAEEYVSSDNKNPPIT